jgi:hypothetical protein
MLKICTFYWGNVVSNTEKHGGCAKYFDATGDNWQVTEVYTLTSKRFY